MTEPINFTAIVWIALTLCAYACALYIHKKSAGNMLLHPLIISVFTLAFALWLTDTSIDTYQTHSSIVHWMLGPATVALAIPLRNQLDNLKRHWRIIILPIIVGGIMGPTLAGSALYFAGLEQGLIITMLTKSITTPLAMETARVMGGYPSLAAVLVILTGIIGALLCSTVFRIIRVRSEIAQGIALGTVAHAVGTAQAFHISEKTGAFASLALCINGLLTAIFLPMLYFYLT
jgi:predicted murein hydrolase (TIGR00659 family)